MKYEMEEVLWIIRKDIRPSTLLLSDNVKEMLTEKTNAILQMIERDRRELKTNLLLNNSNQLVGCIPLYEMDIVKGWDTIHRYLKTDLLLPGAGENRRLMKKSFDRVKNSLKGLLWYIRQHFGFYRNRYQKIPNEVAEDHRGILLTQMEETQRLLATTAVEKLWQQHLLQPLISFMDTSKTFNYYQLDYLKGYVIALEELTHSQDLSSRSATDHLLLQGYNDAGFLHLLITGYKTILANFPDSREGLLYLHTELKHIRQLQPSPPWSYNDTRIDAHELLCHWLEEEIRFAERGVTGEKEAVSPPLPEGGTIRLHLSVYELALSARLLMEAKLISEDSFPKVARWLTANFTTHKNENLSLESFRKKSYEFERSVVNKVKDKIILLMNLAQRF